MATKDLNVRVAALERKLGVPQTAAPKREGRPTLASEIDELEKRLAMYMDDDDLAEDFGETDIVVEDELGCGEEFGMDDELIVPEVELDGVIEDANELGLDDEFGMDGEDEEFCNASEREASEAKPGIEDEITQDYLDEVEEEAHGKELTTDFSMLDAAPTGYTAAEEYVARLGAATARLDKVASYLEQHRRKAMAIRIDKISDAIEARAKKASRRV
jgi:hypothetical protein